LPLGEGDAAGTHGAVLAAGAFGADGAGFHLFSAIESRGAAIFLLRLGQHSSAAWSILLACFLQPLIIYLTYLSAARSVIISRTSFIASGVA
jgi:hypothetical protein